MKRYALLLGTLLTAVYGYAAQAAMTADMARVRVTATRAPTTAADGRIWYGGRLAPVMVVGARPQPVSTRQACEARTRKADS